jgi:hypothetical protein
MQARPHRGDSMTETTNDGVDTLVGDRVHQHPSTTYNWSDDMEFMEIIIRAVSPRPK